MKAGPRVVDVAALLNGGAPQPGVRIENVTELVNGGRPQSGVRVENVAALVNGGVRQLNVRVLGTSAPRFGPGSGFARSEGWSQRYVSPQMQRWLDERAGRTSLGTASGAGSLTSSGPGPGGAGRTIDRGSLRIPDAALADIMRVVHAVRGAGDLELAAEIEDAVIQLASGTEFLLPAVDDQADFGPRMSFQPTGAAPDIFGDLAIGRPSTEWGGHGRGLQPLPNMDPRTYEDLNPDKQVGASQSGQNTPSAPADQDWTELFEPKTRSNEFMSHERSLNKSGAAGRPDNYAPDPPPDLRTKTEEWWNAPDAHARAWLINSIRGTEKLDKPAKPAKGGTEPGDPDGGPDDPMTLRLLSMLLPAYLRFQEALRHPTALSGGPGADPPPVASDGPDGPRLPIVPLADQPGRKHVDFHQVLSVAQRIRRGIGPGVDGPR